MDIWMKKRAFSTLHSLLLFLCISIEAQLFLKRWHPMYHLLPLSCVLVLSALRRFLSTPNPVVFLVDFACLRPHPRLRVPTATFVEHLPLIGRFPEESISFMTKIIASSGLGEETYLPPSLLHIPPKMQHRDSLDEARMLLFPVLDDLLFRTGISPRDVEVLVVNCSGFCPSPSLSSLVASRYAMREDVRTFNVSGMGCSAGAVGVDVASSLLKVHRNSYAVVLSTEILSTGWYAGRDRRKLPINCVFRMGSSAVLLTNAKGAEERSKYKLVHLLRTQRAFEDRAYRSAIREEDSEGVTGFSVERDLIMQVASDTLRSNLVPLGLSILPARVKLKYGVLCLLNSVVKKKKRSSVAPSFGSAVQHYCLPASGRAVMEEIGRGLRLKEGEMEAALATFRRFGNQSSASMWYQLAYIEGKGRAKKGDRVLQLGMGSGPKCNSIVWECLRGTVKELELSLATEELA